MSVEGHAGFQAQGVPGAQARGTGPQLDQPVPEPLGVLALHIDLVAQRLAGVAGLGDAGEVALQHQAVQGVFHGLGDGLSAGEDGHQLLALGALDRDGGPVGGDVGDGDVVVFRDGQQVTEILLGVGGVHHQQEPILLKAVEVGVVDGGAVLGGDDAVLGLVQVQAAHVAGQHMLEKFHPLGAFHQKAAHVGHVKQGAEMSGVEVLCHDAAGILDGHVPSAEIHHGGAGRQVRLVELGALQFAHVVPPHYSF